MQRAEYWIGKLVDGFAAMIMGLIGWLRGIITPWKLASLAAIVFAAGISGTWFNRQFGSDLGGWGWFGAVMIGFGLFAGVQVALHGAFMRNKWLMVLGALLIAVATWIDFTMGSQYFKTHDHDQATAVALGLFAPALAILFGAVEGVYEWIARKDKKEADDLAYQREREREQIEWDRLQQQRREERAEQAQKEIRIATIQAEAERKTRVTVERLRAKELSSANVRELPSDLSALSANVHEQEGTLFTNVHGQNPIARELTPDEYRIFNLVRERFGQESLFTSKAVLDYVTERGIVGKTKLYDILETAQQQGDIMSAGRGKWSFPK